MWAAESEALAPLGMVALGRACYVSIPDFWSRLLYGNRITSARSIKKDCDDDDDEEDYDLVCMLYSSWV